LEQRAAAVPEAEFLVESEVVVQMERVDAARGLQAVSPLGLPLVLEVAMVVQVDFPLELPVMVPAREQEAASRVGLRLILEAALIEVQLPPANVVVV
jgi:hypothetical protein